MSKLSDLLRKRADELGLSQADIVRRGGLTSKMVSVFFSGDTPATLRADTISKWSTALELSEDDIRAALGMPDPKGNFRLSGKRAEQAASLTREQANTVLEVIRLFGESNEREAWNDANNYEPQDELRARREGASREGSRTGQKTAGEETFTPPSADALAAHPYFELHADRVDREFDTLGEENQEEPHEL